MWGNHDVLGTSSPPAVSARICSRGSRDHFARICPDSEAYGRACPTSAFDVPSQNGRQQWSLFSEHSGTTCSSIGVRRHHLGRGGNDTIFGLAGSDVLIGGAGNDILNGGLGADTLIGGDGNDTYVVDNGADNIIEGGTGIDTVNASVSFSIAADALVENLNPSGAALAGTGNALGNVIQGNAANNSLSGLGGNDILRGFGGNDTLIGGEGNDRLDGGVGADLMTGGTATIPMSSVPSVTMRTRPAAGSTPSRARSASAWLATPWSRT